MKAFRLFDDGETGKISSKNLKVAKELGENVSDEELLETIEETDKDGDGEISQEEFLHITKKTSLYRMKCRLKYFKDCESSLRTIFNLLSNYQTLQYNSALL